jgi:hypothetical protein
MNVQCDGTAGEIKNSTGEGDFKGANLGTTYPDLISNLYQDFTPDDNIGGIMSYNPFEDTDFSVQALVNPDAIDGYRTIVSNCSGDDGASAGILLDISSSKYRFFVYASGNPTPTYSTNASIGTEAFLTGVFEAGETCKLYVDDNTPATAGLCVEQNGRVRDEWQIGYRGTSYPRTWDGLINEVRILDAALSADWVSVDYLAFTDGLVTIDSAT